MHSFDDRLPRPRIGSPAPPATFFAVPLTKLAWISCLMLAGSCSACAQTGSDVGVYGNPSQRTVDNDRSSDVAWR